MNIRLSEIDLKKAYRKWHEAAGIFRCFVRASNFVSLKHYTDFVLKKADMSAKRISGEVLAAIDQYYTRDTIVFIDLPDAYTIEAAINLYKERCIMPILSFKGLLHPKGLVGTKEYISSLLLESEELEATQPKGYAFVLDSNRFGDFKPEVLRSNFNNQYELNEEDLPSFEMLMEIGYSKALYLGIDELKEDIEAYLEYLKENGVHVSKVSIGGVE